MGQRHVLMTTSESRGSFPLVAILMRTMASSAVWMGTPKCSITQLTFLLSLPLLYFCLPHILSQLGVKWKEEEMPSHHLLAGGSMKWPKDNCYSSDTGHMVGELVAFSVIYVSTYAWISCCYSQRCFLSLTSCFPHFQLRHCYASWPLELPSSCGWWTDLSQSCLLLIWTARQ